jgi:phosphoglucomutase
VVTASHNPKEYNGYKVYWEDGGQVVPPHDINIISEVRDITRIESVRFDGDQSLIHPIGQKVD